MGRRSDHTRDELFDAALAAAWDIVESQGLRGLTARRIAERIGYSPGTLYNVFENLDDLIVHLQVRVLGVMYETCAAASSDPQPETALKALANAYIEFSSEHSKLWNLLFEHQLPEGRDLPDWYSTKVLRLLGLVEDALAPLFPPGREQERLHSARVLWSALHGICTLAAAQKLVVTETASSLANSLIENYVAGLLQTEARTGE